MSDLSKSSNLHSPFLNFVAVSMYSILVDHGLI